MKNNIVHEKAKTLLKEKSNDVIVAETAIRIEYIQEELKEKVGFKVFDENRRSNTKVFGIIITLIMAMLSFLAFKVQ